MCGVLIPRPTEAPLHRKNGQDYIKARIYVIKDTFIRYARNDQEGISKIQPRANKTVKLRKPLALIGSQGLTQHPIRTIEEQKPKNVERLTFK